MIKLERLARRLYNAPLLIAPEKAEVIEAVFRAHATNAVDHDAEARAREQAQADAEQHAELYAASGVSFARADGGYLVGDNGIAIVQVYGTLVQRADAFDAASGLMGYNRIGAQLAAAMEDESVRGILLEIDSPGGEAAGVFDLAAKIREYAATRPIWSIANEQAFSAAYAIASATDKIYLPQTGGVGSIGVIAMHVDQSKRDASQGYKYTPIYAGKKKNDFSSHEPLSDRAKADAQTSVDYFYGIFVEAVAAGRGISAASVRATEAGVFDAPEAIARQLADGIATFSDVVGMLGEAVTPKHGAIGTVFHGMRATGADANTTMEGNSMQTQANNPTAPAQASAEVLAAARAEGVAEGRGQLEQATAAAATAERTRISTILSCENANGRTAMAMHLSLKTAMPADEAVALLGVSARELPTAAAGGAAPPNLLAGRMASVVNPKVGADASGDGGGEEDEAEAARRVAAMHNKSRGIAAA